VPFRQRPAFYADINFMSFLKSHILKSVYWNILKSMFIIV
jgi:hypothetical protein